MRPRLRFVTRAFRYRRCIREYKTLLRVDSKNIRLTPLKEITKCTNKKTVLCPTYSFEIKKIETRFKEAIE